MYRLTLLLLSLIYVSEGTWWRGHHHHHDHNHDHQHGWGYHMSGYGHGHSRSWHYHDWHLAHDQHFQKLSTCVIEADQYSQSTCKRYSNVDTREVQDPSEYKLVYTMKQCDTNKIVVQIKHRVIYMYARRSDDDAGNYYDVRILPPSLKTKDATWTYKDDELTVVIPYDVENIFKLVGKATCLEVNDQVINVPRAPPFQYRFGV